MKHAFRNILARTAACGLALALAACPAITRAQEDMPATAPSTQRIGQKPVGPFDPQSINDIELGRFATSSARKLIDSNAMPPGDQLAQQITRQTTKVQLAARVNEVLTPEDLYQQRVDSVVAVYTINFKPEMQTSTATGFAISSGGLIVTNYHVARAATEGARGFVVVTRDKRAFPVTEILAASERFDIAIMKIDASSNLKPIPIADRGAIGSDVFLIAHPNRQFWYYTRGMIARYDISLRKTDPVDTMQITAEYGRGSSGGPIMSSRGEVVGMVASTNSVYYTTTPQGQQQNLQMVLRNCVTSQQILSLIEKP
jgi:serine protease Do